MQEAILVPLSLIAGILGSLLGLGGGFIIVPALAYMNFSASQIASTSLFSVLSTSSSSTIAYAKQGRIDYSLGIRLAMLAIPGSIVGAYLSSLMPLASFKAYFGLILIGTSLYILKRDVIKNNMKSDMMAIAYSASFFAGLISSLFGIGGGVVYMPLMIGLLSIPARVSTATSQFILLISSTSGLITHAYLAHPDYISAFILLVGTFAGAQIGARISLSIRESILRKMVSVALILIAIHMLVSSFV